MKKYLGIFMVMFALILSGCGSSAAKQSDKEKVSTKQLIIPKADFYEYVYIQGLNDEGVPSEDTRMTISDITIVKDTLALVDRLVVMRPKYEKDIESVKQLREKGSYILGFGDTKDFRGQTYSIYLLKDGTFYYQDTLGGTEIMYVTIDKHEDILKEIKEKLNVNF
ncbi:MAG: hypothetical protein KBT36_13765 [Kurthia sp.]|nr:hypothetical protein [Candidatus Kurthia equi]